MPRRVTYSNGGRPADVLQLTSYKDPGSPALGQVRIEVDAFPVHPGDLQAIEAAPTGDTLGEQAAGLEATGVITEVGPGTSLPEPVGVGSRVTVFPHSGAWSEVILASADLVVPVPESLSVGAAAQMLVNPLTVVMLRRAAEANLNVGYDGVVVQTAAGSSVGRIFSGASLAHRIGLINVVRSDEGAARLAEQFPGVPVVSTETDGWVERVREAAGGRPIVVGFDPIGGALTEGLLELLAPGGTIFNYGLIAEEPIVVHASTLLNSSLGLRGISIGRWLVDTSVTQRHSDINSAAAIVAALPDLFEPAAEYPLDELADAVEHAVRPGKVGTIVVRVR